MNVTIWCTNPNTWLTNYVDPSTRLNHQLEEDVGCKVLHFIDNEDLINFFFSKKKKKRLTLSGPYMGPARDLDNLVHTQYKPWEIEADTVTQEEMKLFLCVLKMEVINWPKHKAQFWSAQRNYGCTIFLVLSLSFLLYGPSPYIGARM